jgi:uncharacterized glyoxalase superfamily protein PhnB
VTDTSANGSPSTTTERTGKSVSCSIDVAVDPDTAFIAFTDEMDSWWMRSPISFYDSARAIARRCEHGVGGRILEVYDDATGDALELGRITVWEPGARLQWRSSVDDVEVDVRFAPVPDGSNVQVHARVLPGGDDTVTGSFSFVRVVPDWFVKWCRRRHSASRTPRDLSRLNLAVYYRAPVAAARWLADAFGFDPPALPATEEEASWIEFHLGDGALILFRRDDDAGADTSAPITHVPWVFVDELDDHFARAEAHGATIIEGIHQHGYRAYVAADLEGHHWTFAQARPTMAP